MIEIVQIPTSQYPHSVRSGHYPDGRTCFIVEHSGLPECVAYGESYADALRALEAVRGAYFASLTRHGEPIPPPPTTTTSMSWAYSPTPIQGVAIHPARSAEPLVWTAA